MARARVDNNSIYYKCPACKREHSVPIGRWNWNGSLDRPTLTPSVRHFVEHARVGQETVCHYFITDGSIVFCSDNPHDFNGKTVELEEYDRTTEEA